jgi:twitching motility protein PilT
MALDLARLFRLLREAKGSDLHLSAGLPPAYRVSGHIEPMPGEPPLDDEELRAALVSLVEPAKWQVFVEEHDFDFAYALPGVGRFRGNYFEQGRGVGAIFRLVPEQIVPASELGLPASIPKLAELESGLVLVTGPTGSGKSTTLASIIDLINQNSARHIVTIEDPIEFVHQNKKSVLSHREIGSHAASFAEALKAALRQDAEVVLIGEMRDFETISLAMEAAGMGVLVFGTLHTNGAAKTIDRIVDVFPADQKSQARGMLADSLMAVVSQILCRKVGGGRLGVHEILLREAGLAGAIREGNPGMLNSIIGAGKGRGMQLLDDALEKAVAAGQVEGREAYFKANDKKRFERWAEDAKH